MPSASPARPIGRARVDRPADDREQARDAEQFRQRLPTVARQQRLEGRQQAVLDPVAILNAQIAAQDRRTNQPIDLL